LTDVSFANNTAQGGDTSGAAQLGGSAGAGMGSRSIGGGAGGLGNVGGGDDQDCTAAIPGADTQNRRDIGSRGLGTAGGGLGRSGGGAGGSQNGSTFIPGGFGGGRGYVNGGGGAAFGAAVFVRDGGTLALHATRAQAMSGGQLIAGVGKNGVSGGTDEQ